ncbi:MAG TPA: SH3 domain-containing protein [Anaerolineales bacterium]|nr:SH3 domain-containing protein [Anaerolineales bacterium]
MKICAYCTTRNRDEAIFCSHCRRPLRTGPIPRDRSLLWLLAIIALIGLGFYFFLSWPFFNSSPGASSLNEIVTPGSSPTQVHESFTIYTCVEDSTHIRRGPSTGSETTSGLTTGTCLRILGRTEDETWVYVVSDDHKTGWVSADILPRFENLHKVSVREDSALANPARPTLTSAEIAHGAQAYLTKIAATTIPGAPLSAYIVPCLDAVDRVGDYVSCKIERAYCDYLPELEGSPTFCNDRPHPDHNFALVVFGKDWSQYDGQCIIVEGYLQIDRGVLAIQALKRDQVSACS